MGRRDGWLISDERKRKLPLRWMHAHVAYLSCKFAPEQSNFNNNTSLLGTGPLEPLIALHTASYRHACITPDMAAVYLQGCMMPNTVEESAGGLPALPSKPVVALLRMWSVSVTDGCARLHLLRLLGCPVARGLLMVMMRCCKLQGTVEPFSQCLGIQLLHCTGITANSTRSLPVHTKMTTSM